MDLYARRRLRNRIVLALSFGATGLGLGWLVLILGALIFKGASGLSLQVFTEMTPPPGADGGLLNPIVGSLILTGLAAQTNDKLNLTFQLNTVGAARFQLGDFSLQALPQLAFLSIGRSPADPTALSLSWFGTTNQNYQVQSRTSFGSGTWTNLGSALPGQGAASTLALPAVAGDPARFYRLMMTTAN